MQERRVRPRQTKPLPVIGAKGDVRQEVTGLLTMAAGAWFLFALTGRGGMLGDILGIGLRAVTGASGAWIAAVLFVWFGLLLIYLRFHGRPFLWGRRSWGLTLILLFAALAIQLWYFADHPLGGDWQSALHGMGGGMIGFALAVPLTKIFGVAGRYVILVAGLLIGLVLNTEITLGAFVHWGKERAEGGARGAKDAAGDFYKLVTTKPKGERAEAPPTEPLSRARNAAATEELNTIGSSAIAPTPAPQVGLEQPAVVEPIIRTQEPIIRVDKPIEMAVNAAKSVQAATDKLKQTQELPAAKLVANTLEHLNGDPERLSDVYQLPSIGMLPKPVARLGTRKEDYLERSALLERTLRTFGVEAKVIEISPGPAVTRFELQPGEGVRVNKFTALADDLALALAAEDIRIEAPIPGKAAVGIEVPNKERLTVPLREVMETPQFLNSSSKLTVAFGKDNAGNPVVGDLGKMPHLLIAGSTGSGKSVCMNTIICSLLFKARPDEVKMLMIDPKMVELSNYNGVPHLIAPVIIDTKKAAGYLKGAVKEMEGRYEVFAAAGARNIQQYNQMCIDNPGPDPEHPRKPLAYIVIFIDELADLMMVAPVDVEDSICRLAQMARACGMHLVIATQSPRVDVITGLIKANVPSRIAFAVSSQIDSRVIMDYAGAERLLGRGDMLYHANGLSKAIRVQGAFIGDQEVEDLVKFVKAQGQPIFTAEEVAVELGSKKGAASNGDGGEPTSAADTVFPQAVRVVVEHGQASVSILQRRLRCNYNKAARLIDMMEERGFIGPHQGSKPRDVLLSMGQWQELFGTNATDGVDTAESEA